MSPQKVIALLLLAIVLGFVIGQIAAKVWGVL